MNVSDLLTYCMHKEGAEQRVHDDWKSTQILRDGVLFAMFHKIDGKPAVSLKSSEALASLLRNQHQDVRPSEHLNKAHWNTVMLNGSLKDSELYYLVDASYQQAEPDHIPPL